MKRNNIIVCAECNAFEHNYMMLGYRKGVVCILGGFYIHCKKLTLGLFNLGEVA